MDKEIIQDNNNCNELKALKYKSMILNGIPWPEYKSTGDLVNLDKFLSKII